ncbi:protein of unknown function [Methylocaldum szegediense]|uniref:Uncharacterized protein n=1 Tax=Methylocaldum szegediense TaxID=73780 RepID=A0ABM9I3W9_9GAMM|nr:protein of unknown function [Methylocaldum szegediense]
MAHPMLARSNGKHVVIGKYHLDGWKIRFSRLAFTQFLRE